MSFSLPDSKIQSISLSAQTLLNQPKVLLRKLSQFIGMFKLFKTNPPSTSGSFNYVRCVRSSLGSSPRICKNSGFWRSYQFSWHMNRKELKAAFLALKFLIPNRTNVHVQICIDNRTAVAYINHLGGTRSLELNSIALKMWAWCLERNMFFWLYMYQG